MDHRESKTESIGICNKLYNFITQTFLRHALKTVALGRPLPHLLPDTTATTKQTEADSKGNQVANAVAQEMGTKADPEPEPARNSYPFEQTESGRGFSSVGGTGLVSSSLEIDAKNDDRHVSSAESGEKEATEPGIEGKAPKKTVSINENVEEIRWSRKYSRKKSTERLPSLELQGEPKPLKSILKVGSDLNKNSFINRSKSRLITENQAS